jgi:sugar lactone lactonase YvrE
MELTKRKQASAKKGDGRVLKGRWDNIHSDIRTASQPIAEAGKFDDAIFAAFRYVEGEIQDRIGSTKVGQALIDEAFEGPIPRIDISDDIRNRQGIKEIFSGALLTIRNDRGHKKSPSLPCNTLDACLLHLSFASFLLYLLSKDKNNFPQIQAVRTLGSYEQPRVELRGSNFGSSPRVLANNDEAWIVKTTPTIIEALLTSGFSGTIKITSEGNESNGIVYDARVLEQRNENVYEPIATEIPLYADAACTRLYSGVVGLLLLATEGGREFIRLIPTSTGQYKAGSYITHGPFSNETVGEAWYRDPNNGEIKYAWAGSTVATPEIVGPVGTPELVGISLLPNRIKVQDDERRPLQVTGVTRDGAVTKENDVTNAVTWRTLDSGVAYVKDAVVYGKRLGRTKVECELQSFVASADVWVEHSLAGDKAIYCQGFKRLQQVRVDQDDNLYFCNQSASVYRIARTGSLEEVARIPLAETSSYGIDCIAIDGNRHLYVSDVEKRVCLRIPWKGHNYGSPTIVADSVNGTKKSIAVDSMGNVFVAVMGPGPHAGSIVHVKPDGRERSFPTRDMAIYVALDRQGNILTPSRRERAIHVYDREGELVDVIAHGVEDAESDILVDQTGAIYMPFFHSGRLVKITQDSSGPSTELIAEGFQNPGGIAMDSQGHIYVSNFGGNSIEMIY